MPELPNTSEIPADILQKVSETTATKVNSPYVSPILAQTLFVLSKPIRVQLLNFLQGQEAALSVAKGRLMSQLSFGDILSKKVQVLSSAVEIILEPADRLMAALPLDTIVKSSPELVAILKNIVDSVPVKIPEVTATAIAGIGGFDFFEGITSYKDLRRKIQELEFRAARATALTNYASAGMFYLDAQIDKVKAYIYTIELLSDF